MLLRGVCPNKVKDLTTPPSLADVVEVLCLPMVQAIASLADVGQAALVVAVVISRGEGEQPRTALMGGTVPCSFSCAALAQSGFV